MASMMALPREGHLAVVFNIFSLLKIKHNGVAVLDPAGPEIDQTQFPNEHWSATPFGPYKEDVPSSEPAPRGTGFAVRAFVDSDHADNSVTRHYRTGFIALLNRCHVFV